MTVDLTERLHREIQHGGTEVAVRQARVGLAGRPDSPYPACGIFTASAPPVGAGPGNRRRNGPANRQPDCRDQRCDGDLQRPRDLPAGERIFVRAVARHALQRRYISPDLLEIARQRAPGATYHVMDAHAPEFPDGSFDAVLGVSILHHLEWDTALASCLRLLRPGGVVRFSEPNLMNPQIYLQKRATTAKEKPCSNCPAISDRFAKGIRHPPRRSHGGNRAFYAPGPDLVQQPSGGLQEDDVQNHGQPVLEYLGRQLGCTGRWPHNRLSRGKTFGSTFASKFRIGKAQSIQRRGFDPDILIYATTRAVESLKQYREVNLYLQGIIPLLGFRSEIVYYSQATRFAGQSKYPLHRMITLA